MSQLFIEGIEVDNINIAVVLLEEDILLYLISADELELSTAFLAGTHLYIKALSI